MKSTLNWFQEVDGCNNSRPNKVIIFVSNLKLAFQKRFSANSGPGEKKYALRVICSPRRRETVSVVCQSCMGYLLMIIVFLEQNSKASLCFALLGNLSLSLSLSRYNGNMEQGLTSWIHIAVCIFLPHATAHTEWRMSLWTNTLQYYNQILW